MKKTKSRQSSIDCIYFETSILREAQWPRISAKLGGILSLSRDLHIDVFIPTGVELELEQNWLREWDKRHTALKKAILDFQKWTRAETIKFDFSRDRHLDAYRCSVAAEKQRWDIKNISLPSPTIDSLFEMAIKHQPPFNERGAGFQDAIIFLSVIENVKSKPSSHAAFVAKDTDLNPDVISKLATSSGVEIVPFTTLEGLLKALEQRLGSLAEQAWEEDKKIACEALNGMMPAIEKYLNENLRFSSSELSSIGWSLGKGVLTVVKVLGVCVQNINPESVWTLPPDQKNPDDRKISFRVSVALSVIVQGWRDVKGQPLKVGEVNMPTAAMFQSPVTSTRLHETEVEVEVSAKKVNNKYDNIQLVSAQLVPRGLIYSAQAVK